MKPTILWGLKRQTLQLSAIRSIGMMPRFTVWFLACCCLLMVTETSSAVTDYQVKQIEGQLNHPDAKLDPQYFDGENINKEIPFPQFNNYYTRFLKRYKNAVNYWNRLSAKDRADPKMAAVKTKLDEATKWKEGIAKVYPQALEEYNIAAKQQKAGATAAAKQAATNKKAIDDKCRLFKREVMTVERMYSMMGLLGRAGHLSGGSPGTPQQIKERAEAVTKACSQPKFADVGVGGCQWLKIPPDRAQWNPEEWCAVAPKWREILRAQVDARIAKDLETWNHRPLLALQLKGEQSLRFFSKAVPNESGWRDIHSWKDLYFPDDWKKKYPEKFQQLYDELELNEKVPTSLFAPVYKAFEDLRQDAKTKNGQWDLPKDAGKDYSVDLAKTQHANFTAKGKFIKAWLSRDSWRIHKNALGVPLRRTKPGFVYYSVDGQSLCQITAYTLTEPHLGGGKYEKATKVTWGYTRLQGCP